ncbi:MAG TPA: TIGR01777 family oxidoreductase [Acidimicrobiales bacterium]|nr:TIGR01777 family oxidoreductase [Acidimicrobiales bacterium]
MQVVVTGSSGPIGNALCSHLAGSGHHVVRVVRRPVRPGEDAVGWDPEAGTIDAGGLEGVDAVVHLAGAGIGDRRWNEARKHILVESRTRSTALLAGALAGLDRRPRVLVSASAIGFYGNRGDEILTEQSPAGDDFLASLCVRWEGEAARAAEAGVRVVCARTGLVLSKAGGALPKLLPLFTLGLGGRFGSGAQWWSWITLDDEIRAIEWLLENDIRGPVNLTAPNPVTNREFTRILGAVLSRPARLPVPRFGPRLLLGSELADALLFTSARVQPAVLESSGFAFSHSDLEPGLRDLLKLPPP